MGLPGVENTERRHGSNPTVRMETAPRHTQTKPSTHYTNSRETTQRQVGY